MMTPRERFVTALERRPLSGRVPHFELVFFLTMEAFGKVWPGHRIFSQWDQMSAKEQKLQIADAASVYIAIASRYDHSAIFIHGIGGVPDSERLIADDIRRQTGKEYFLMRHGDATLSIPGGNSMVDFSLRLVDDPVGIKRDCEDLVAEQVARAEKEKDLGLWDGFALCADYCLNTGPFLSPAMFAEFVTPYLAKLVTAYRGMGYYTIKHTDGNIMPILDQLVQCRPHALHSLDPQAGVDMAEVKRRHGRELCLIGNVNCALLQTGTDAECIAAARYALQHGMPGGGYIFSTSNCIYTGMPLHRYELMLDVWRREGNY
ncbi:MAG: uroporphyrinogen decarboxylase family protein [Verrucomicrobia bacterium]|nr:uroporphyrinogen decarboxylase family protein [Verrucomicrobiota bacterium]MCG2681918.1 uroporphyrinogen decarboxylase family protein [Kiritimatiellia bacterium]MBU4246758.1 uroporphyrinogen decarboxylase family protein [Verrucomicrobiota bacterium]MBU4291179.1 uroporphyrinogen decarboxylase family protein [Verrucomicrobiota bacterium]MBU4428949.1 uroporphyrinogen decarboxylase family protein [Verrucomicrobiota bacterium]